jgi:ABC-type multidrug transport system fused ATPase/permease subunit
VQLKYRPNTEIVLHNLSFEVEPGHKIGIVGRTGAGKSTISLALARIVELHSGQIFIDGQDISLIDLSEHRQNVTVIAQDPTLFTGTLRFNLDPLGRETDERLEYILYKAGLRGLLEREAEREDPRSTELRAKGRRPSMREPG